MDEMDDKPARPELSEWSKKWRAQPWAEKAARKKEAFAGDPLAHDWQKQRADYKKNPEAYKTLVQQELEDYRSKIREFTEHNIITDADNCREFDLPEIIELQKTIDDMARAFAKFEVLPKLVIYEVDIFSGGQHTATIVPEFIETNFFSLKYYLDHPSEFRAAMAHEMGHIANNDLSVATRISRLITPPNQEEEVLADIKGAIIYGNPKEYAEAMHTLVNEQCGMSHLYDEYYLSNNSRSRQLHKWVEDLERNHATDPATGRIIDMEKAMQTYERFEKYYRVHVDRFVNDTIKKSGRE